VTHRRLRDPFLLAAVVETVQELAPSIRRIVLSGPAMAGLAWTPGQQVRVQVPATGAVDWLVGTMRTYSVWDYDGRHLELRVFDHGSGPGSSWARTVRPGERVLVLGPHGDFVVREAAFHLFVGEETASVAFGPMLRALPGTARVAGVVEVDTPQERLELDLAYTYRDGAPAASSLSLLEAVRALDLPSEPGVGYLAGEARTIQLVRTHLVRERGWPRRSVLTKPFWTPGRKGLE
jgi:NADPH-dependent ferric siderophore reductase